LERELRKAEVKDELLADFDEIKFPEPCVHSVLTP